MKTIFSLAALLICINLFAQDETSVSFVAYWKKGDTKTYMVTKKNIQYKNDTLVKESTDGYIVKFVVVDSTATSYVIDWNYENTLFQSTALPKEVVPVLEKYKNINIRYTTDELGAFKEVLNWKEVGKMMNEMFDKLLSSLSENKTDVSKAIKPFKEIYSSKEGIESLVMKEIQYFHWPFGIAAVYGDTLRYEEYLPNMLGGDPIKANGAFYFEQVDFENEKCKFVNTLDLDSVDTKRVLTDVMNSMVAKISYESKKEREEKTKELQEEFGKMGMKVTDYNTFHFLYNPGWPIKIHTKRISLITTSGSIGKRIDEVVIEELN